MNVQEFIEILTAALSFKFPNDTKMPGVTISYLKNKQYYVSLVRYCPGKKVIIKASHLNLCDALGDVGAQLLVYQNKKAEKDPMDYLEEAVFYFNPKPEDDEEYRKKEPGDPWVEDARHPDPYGDNDSDIPF